MNSRERVIAAITFENPDRIPVDLWTVPAVFIRHDGKVNELLRRFPTDFARSEWNPDAMDPRMQVGEYEDEWGCVWNTKEAGYFGIVSKCPLENYGVLDGYKMPFEEMERWVRSGSAAHPEPGKFWLGFGADFFHRMCWLRGMDRVMIDLMEGSREIYLLRDMLYDFFSRQIRLWLEAPVDGIMFADDWGSQTQLLISPDMWRSFIKPVYKEFFDIIKASGRFIFFHSDGNIIDIIDDFIELGVNAINCQVWCMGPDALGKGFTGRIAFQGELDRQRLIPWGCPDEILDAARTMKCHLSTPRGGLIGQGEVDGLTSLENIEAVLTAWNR